MFLDQNRDNYIDLAKTLSYKDLDLFAIEIREFLIDKVSKSGGHLASNLGAVELTLALHRVFNTPKDKIVFDVGHQSYVHKLLTGRKNDFDSLRQLDGMSGFPKRSESDHDAFDSGHSSTSVSVAYGYAVARDLRGEKYNCVAVIGDGALTGGVSFEAMNMAGATKNPLIVIVNDNQMSIDGSTGGVNERLTKLRTSAPYLHFKNTVKKNVNENSGIYQFMKNTRDVIKDAVLPSGLYEDLGFKYFGPIDGHNIKDMVEVFESAKELNRPVVVHVVTKKGKGFLPAEKNPTKFHGIGKFNPSEVSSVSSSDGSSYSEIFGNKLFELAEKDEKICAISAAMVCATGLNIMKGSYPSRVFDVGIAEQHAVSFAAGLALNGMKPVVAIYSTFLQRAYDQIVTEIAMQKLPVVFAIDRAGITGQDGETHQGSFDISYLNLIPNMTILAPKDGRELEEMLEYAISLGSPCAIRYPRGKDFDLSAYSTDTAINKAELITDDSDYAILALGSMVKEAVDAYKLLDEAGIKVAVYNMRCVKPLDYQFLDSLKKYKRLITVEDGCLCGGFGESIAEYLGQEINNPPVRCIAIPDKFIEHGEVSQLRNRYGLDAVGIAKTAMEFFK